MKKNIKAEIVNNVVVTMSVYISDKEILDVLARMLANELMRVNIEEITTLPAEVKSSVDQRNAYLVQLFLLQKRSLKPSTLEAYMGTIKKFVTAVQKRLDEVETIDIEWYLAQYEKRVGIHKERVSDRSYNNERRNLSAFYTWMRKAKLISDNPVEGTDPKKVALPKIDYYSREEVIKLRDACETERERAIIEVFRSTGARVGEIADIRIDQVNMKTGDIEIIGEKGGRPRTLYLDEDARHYLSIYLTSRDDDSPYLFTQSIGEHRGKLITPTYREIMRKIGSRAHIEGRVYPHKMRKTLGMTLKNQGVDIGIIQEILGHASPAVTSMYYAQSTAESLRAVRKRMSA